MTLERVVGTRAPFPAGDQLSSDVAFEPVQDLVEFAPLAWRDDGDVAAELPPCGHKLGFTHCHRRGRRSRRRTASINGDRSPAAT
ncbi:hypothetical protein [Rhodococcus sp. YH1]|uniref:hypothetical protein n=1 Tax=Rhodococcus sp. YH1 TaxID=89066 RepID=UPI0013866795